MKSQSYMTRALQARDPRFARLLGRLGYSTADIMADEPEERTLGLVELRKAYEEVIGKRPFHGWDAETLTAKIAAKRDEG